MIPVAPRTLVELAVASQGPGFDNGAGDALEAVRAEIVQLADRGGVAALLEGLGGNDDAGHGIAGVQAEQALRRIGRGSNVASNSCSRGVSRFDSFVISLGKLSLSGLHGVN